MAETTNRVLTLLSLLQSHRQWPGPELARRLAITPRTLRRDIDLLREIGYRIVAERGVTGGYRLEAGERMPPLLLTDDESVAVAVGLRVAATHGLVDGEDTTLSALAKFEQVLPPTLRERVNALGRFVTTASPRDVRVPAEILGQLALACRDRERIRFHYTARDGTESDRVAEPAALVAAERAWYLVAWDVRREDWRTFRVDRLSRFFGTRVSFPERTLPTEDAAQFVRSSIASANGGATVERAAAVISIDERGMREWFGPWSDAVEVIDSETVRWTITGDSVESMIAALAWVPPGVAYRLEGSPAFLEAARAFAGRLAGAADVTP